MTKSKNLLTLTAALIMGTTLPRLDGTAPEEGGERTLTKEQWEAQEHERLAKKSIAELTTELVKVKADNFELRKKKAPEGGLILDAEQARRWQAWEALGKPEDVTAELASGKEAREKVAKAEKREALAAVADAAGWDAETFADLDALAGGLEWLVTDVTEDGETRKKVTVKVDGKDVDSATFAGQRWAKFKPVLVKEGAESVQTATPEVQVVRIPTGGAGGGKGKTYTVADAEQRLAESGKYTM